MDNLKYTVSTHAKERYTQRIMNRDNMTDIRMYVTEHDHDIEIRINKLIEYGKKIYEGPLGNKNFVEVYIKDLWVVLVGPTKKVVITLYKIDFGDDEFNEFFVKKMLSKIDDTYKAIEDELKNADTLITSYSDVIKANNDDIQYLRTQIKNLQDVNEAYEILISDAKNEADKTRRKLRLLVEQLILKKEF